MEKKNLTEKQLAEIAIKQDECLKEYVEQLDHQHDSVQYLIENGDFLTDMQKEQMRAVEKQLSAISYKLWKLHRALWYCAKSGN